MEIKSCSIILEPTFILLELICDIHLGVTVSSCDQSDFVAVYNSFTPLLVTWVVSDLG
jgi:hypothetical protein